MTTTPVKAREASRDPRPTIDRQHLVGARCGSCGYPMTVSPPRCPSCGEGPMEPARFGPLGTVWTSTVLRIPVPGREPPYALAYVDIDDGPRILAHVDGATDTAPAPGSRVRLTGHNDHGDPLVTVEAER